MGTEAPSESLDIYDQQANALSPSPHIYDVQTPQWRMMDYLTSNYSLYIWPRMYADLLEEGRHLYKDNIVHHSQAAFTKVQNINSTEIGKNEEL